jgi:hypothetical protein
VAVELTAEAKWGVTVEEVSALAPHITIGEAPVVPVDDTFYIPADRKITVNEVEQFISDVAGRASLRLSGLGSVSDTERKAVVGQAAHDAVVNGAASYLVSAAYPVGGSVNGDGGYAALLWSRYETALDTAGSTLDAWLTDPAIVPAPVPDTTGRIGYAFPTTMFPDGARY